MSQLGVLTIIFAKLEIFCADAFGLVKLNFFYIEHQNQKKNDLKDGNVYNHNQYFGGTNQDTFSCKGLV